MIKLMSLVNMSTDDLSGKLMLLASDKVPDKNLVQSESAISWISDCLLLIAKFMHQTAMENGSHLLF